MTMIATHNMPHLDIDPTLAPDELTLISLIDRDEPSWLVWSYTAFVMTICDVCHEFIGRRETVYFEPERYHPAHITCWLTQLTARPVRVVKVRYHGIEVDDGTELLD